MAVNRVTWPVSSRFRTTDLQISPSSNVLVCHWLFATLLSLIACSGRAHVAGGMGGGGGVQMVSRLRNKGLYGRVCRLAAWRFGLPALREESPEVYQSEEGLWGQGWGRELGGQPPKGRSRGGASGTQGTFASYVPHARVLTNAPPARVL